MIKVVFGMSKKRKRKTMEVHGEEAMNSYVRCDKKRNWVIMHTSSVWWSTATVDVTRNDDTQFYLLLSLIIIIMIIDGNVTTMMMMMENCSNFRNNSEIPRIATALPCDVRLCLFIIFIFVSRIFHKDTHTRKTALFIYSQLIFDIVARNRCKTNNDATRGTYAF